MSKLSVREFSHDLAGYLKRAGAGERLVVTFRNKPIVDVVPHAPEPGAQGWKRPLRRVKLSLGGLSVGAMLIKARREASY